MRRAASAVLCLVVALVAGSERVAAAGSCPAMLYVGALEQARTQLDATPANVVVATAALSRAVAGQPVARPIVDPIIGDLTASPPDTVDARAALNALVAVLQLPAGAACNVDSSAARSALRDVYGSPVFANLDQSQQPSVFSRIVDFLSSLVSRLLQTLGQGGSIALGLLILGLVVAAAAWRLRGMLGGAAARQGAEPPGDTDDPAREWRMADRAAAQRQYREAIRRAFRSALLEVALRGRLRVDSSWTTRELLAAAVTDADLAAALAPAAAGFDRAWYSGEAVRAEAWEEARRRCESIRELARHRPQEATV